VRFSFVFSLAALAITGALLLGTNACDSRPVFPLDDEEEEEEEEAGATDARPADGAEAATPDAGPPEPDAAPMDAGEDAAEDAADAADE
jgi:hypothetical protein